VKRIPAFIASLALVVIVGFSWPATAQVRFDGTLEKDLHANRVKVGDTLTVRIKSEVTLKDGTTIPKNSKVQGHVTEVKKAKNGEPSTIALLFDKLILDKKEEKPLAVTLISVAPAPNRRGVDNLAAQSGMTGAGRVSAMAAESGRGAEQESSATLKSGVGANRGPGTDPALSPGLSTIENVSLRYKASGPDTILENKKEDVYVPRWTKMLFQVN
jgi:hypothetical protein